MLASPAIETRPGQERRSADPIKIFGLTLAVFVLVQLLAPTLQSLFLGEASYMVGLGFVKSVKALGILGIVWSLGSFAAVGFRAPVAPISLLYGLPMILLGFVTLMGAETLSTAPGFLIGWFWVSLVGMTSEEVVFRGALWEALIHRGPWRTALITSAGFGSIHLMGLQTDLPSTVILSQVFFAFGGGMALAAVRMRAGSLWTALMLHQGFNCAAFWAAGGLKPVFEPGTEVRFLTAGLVLAVWGAVAVKVALKRAEAID
jgi:membrane protease YdiL (CAAX protease family)